MSKISERQKALKEAEEMFMLAVIDSDSELEEDTLICYTLIAESRYFNKSEHHRKKHDDYFFTTKFYALTDDEFRQHFRTTRYGFSVIAKLIEQHPVFHNNSNCSQMRSAWQLAVALQRLGHYGSRAAVKIVATDFGISAGPAIEYTNRVMTALASLAPKWMNWPDEYEREEHGLLMRQEGFPGCVGFIGGTTLPLHQKPAQEGAAYFDRNKRYSVNTQILCDMHGRIIAVHTGCPGSTADSIVFKRIEQFQSLKDFFSAGEYLLADSAYAVSKHCIPPYKSSAADLPDNTAFNFYLARSRARNEHCIGVLKGRWQSLKELRHQLQDDSSMENLCYWVISCCVLHNLMAHINDTWTEEPEEESRAASCVGSQATLTGTTFREALKKTTLETNRAKKSGP